MSNFFKHMKLIGELDVMPFDNLTTYKVYRYDGKIIVVDEKSNSRIVYNIFKLHHSKARYVDLFGWSDIDYMLEMRLWVKPKTDEWLLIRELMQRGVVVKFIKNSYVGK